MQDNRAKTKANPKRPKNGGPKPSRYPNYYIGQDEVYMAQEQELLSGDVRGLTEKEAWAKKDKTTKNRVLELYSKYPSHAKRWTEELEELIASLPADHLKLNTRVTELVIMLDAGAPEIAEWVSDCLSLQRRVY
jgi:hypothetical protein